MKTYIILAALLSMALPAFAEMGTMARPDNDQIIASSGWSRVENLDWKEVRRAHAAGFISATFGKEAKAFDRRRKVWIDIPLGTELASIGDRCTGWMNGFITGRYAGHDELYFREWDVVFHDKVTGQEISGLLKACQRTSLTRELIMSAQQEGLVQAFTNKGVALMGENGAFIYVGPRFRHRENFEVEWLSRSTSGILRIAANREVTPQMSHADHSLRSQFNTQVERFSSGRSILTSESATRIFPRRH